MNRSVDHIREFARVGFGHFWHRQVMYVGATVISLFFFDTLLSLCGLLACSGVDIVDRRFCRAALDADLTGPKARRFHHRRLFVTGTLLVGAIVGYASAVALTSPEGAHLAALLFLLAAAQCAAINQHQLEDVVYARLGLLAIGALALALLPVWRGSVMEPALIWPPFLATIFAFLFIFESARTYHRHYLDKLDQIAELDKARTVAEREHRDKSTMISTMSHELRTPLNGILGMAQILNLSELTDEQRHSLGVIQTSGLHLNALLTDILDTEKLMAGSMKLFPVDADPRTVLKDVIAAQSIVAAEKGLVLTADYASDIPAYLRLDPVRTTQCVANLVSNAIKFTRSGQITVTARYRASDEGSTLLIDVVDTGIGMTEREIAALFNPFKQANQSIKREYGGTGLGLWISRNLARMMGGDLTVESTPAQGSRFRLSVGAAPAINSADLPKGALAGVRVLHVDDLEVNRHVMRMLLDPHGIELTAVDTANQALERIEADRFDIVLSDAAMPGMSGAEMAARIRGLATSSAQIPVIAVSADTTLADPSVLESRGFDAFVAKPVDERSLVSAILRHTPRQASCAREPLEPVVPKLSGAAANAPTQPGSEPRVLVAESAGSSRSATSSSGS